MKLLKMSTLVACGVLLSAATRGTEVSKAQIDQFQTGAATISDVEAKLGMPQRTRTLDNGHSGADYIMMEEAANAASYVPFARLAAGAMNVHETRVEFEFDLSGRLVGVQTSQRDIVCPHRACPADQMAKPWIPMPTSGD